ncbi:MAG: Type 1 glutamine amidotransferase-like domain-containing protein [Candidatus Levybacteria bacterium]|nr:Type 1 glutamine amidotransferase-like domain-containing protein [Candidatus Levybacteria bacterium]
MKRIILFSTPTPSNLDKILSLVFPKEIEHKVFAYMPSDGANCPQKYRDEWKGYAKKHGAKFVYVDNSKENASDEVNKLIGANILIITGGNTFKLLDNLRKSGLDKAIKKFSFKSEFVLAGFSAGALVLTPTIEVCNLTNYDKNEVGLKDLTGLGVVNFEVFPHYSEQKHNALLNEYKTHAKNEVKEITNEDRIVLDL